MVNTTFSCIHYFDDDDDIIRLFTLPIYQKKNSKESAMHSRKKERAAISLNGQPALSCIVNIDRCIGILILVGRSKVIVVRICTVGYLINLNQRESE